MFSAVELENYRGFVRYRVANLATVNLLVGKNNCGKTSVLEALNLLATDADPAVLARIAADRGEVVPVDEPELSRRSAPVLSHFFHGRELSPGSCFTLRTEPGSGDLRGHIVGPAEFDDEQEVFSGRFRYAAPTLGFQVSRRTKATESRSQPIVPLTDDGAVLGDALRSLRRRGWRESDELSPVMFVSPDSLAPLSMGEMWDNVLRDGREAEVVQALRMLEPRLTNIFFLGSGGVYRAAGRAGILVSLEGERQRVPLGSYGDGMRRLLALALCLVRSQNGLLLVDEIDTGLHYSIMGDMWRLVVEAARAENVQVFATTHSLDCVRGLAWLAENYPQLRAEVSLQKIEATLDESVALNGEELEVAVGGALEVR